MHHRTQILAGLTCAVIFYVLAVGPAVWFGYGPQVQYGRIPDNSVGMVWRPVLELESTRIGPAFRAYMELWGVTYFEPCW